jgi:hypothetical protein
MAVVDRADEVINLNFNFLRDIASVAGIMRVPEVMGVNPSVPAKTSVGCSTPR